MKNDDIINILFPNISDKYNESIISFFFTIASIESEKFIGIDYLTQEKYMFILNSEKLKNIYNSYKGNISKSEYWVRAFVSSLYELNELNIKNPTNEWRWISKLCHLLIYFAQHNLYRRIYETCRESRQWLKRNSSYHQLWQFCCEQQKDTLFDTFECFKRHLLNLQINNHPHSKKFQIIYRSIEFAYHERHPITRTINSKVSHLGSSKQQIRIDSYNITDSDDNDQLCEVIKFDNTVDNIDINRERLDLGVADFVIVKQDNLREQEKYSARQLLRRTQAKFSHINKNEIFIMSSLRHLSIALIPVICKKLWFYFDSYNDNRNLKTACAYLLLSLYTGRSVQALFEDIFYKYKKIIDINIKDQRYHLLIDLDITPLRIKTTGIHEVIANQVLSMVLPLPDKLGVFLSYKLNLDHELILHVINRLKNELNLPFLSLARLEKSLYTLLIHNICNTQIASIITSRNQHKRADIWYCSHSHQEIFACYQQAVLKLTQYCIIDNSYLYQNYHHTLFLGSQNCPNYNLVKIFISYLHLQINSTKNYLMVFNHYNIWMWHICLLLTSVRAVQGAPGFLNQFNLTTGLAWISDKEGRATTSSQRYVPLCDFVIEAITAFVDYLRRFSQSFQRLNPDIYQYIDDILLSKRPLLNYFDKKGVMHELTPAYIHKILDSHFKFKADWTRHVGQKFLHEQQVDEAVILAVFGHEMVGQESWQKHSSFSIGDILKLKHVYQKLANMLNLQPVRI